MFNKRRRWKMAPKMRWKTSQKALNDLPDVEIVDLKEGDHLHPIVDSKGKVIVYTNTSAVVVRLADKDN